MSYNTALIESNKNRIVNKTAIIICNKVAITIDISKSF